MSTHIKAYGSYVAVGNFIREAKGTKLVYEDAENSKAAYQNLITLEVLTTTVGGGILISERFKTGNFKKLIEDNNLNSVGFKK